MHISWRELEGVQELEQELGEWCELLDLRDLLELWSYISMRIKLLRIRTMLKGNQISLRHKIWKVLQNKRIISLNSLLREHSKQNFSKRLTPKTKLFLWMSHKTVLKNLKNLTIQNKNLKSLKSQKSVRNFQIWRLEESSSLYLQWCSQSLSFP